MTRGRETSAHQLIKAQDPVFPLTWSCASQKLVEALATAKADALLSRDKIADFAKEAPTLLLTR